MNLCHWHPALLFQVSIRDIKDPALPYLPWVTTPSTSHKSSFLLTHIFRRHHHQKHYWSLSVSQSVERTRISFNHSSATHTHAHTIKLMTYWLKRAIDWSLISLTTQDIRKILTQLVRVKKTKVQHWRIDGSVKRPEQFIKQERGTGYSVFISIEC